MKIVPVTQPTAVKAPGRVRTPTPIIVAKREIEAIGMLRSS